jgi:hypothetical protein
MAAFACGWAPQAADAESENAVAPCAPRGSADAMGRERRAHSDHRGASSRSPPHPMRGRACRGAPRSRAPRPRGCQAAERWASGDRGAAGEGSGAPLGAARRIRSASGDLGWPAARVPVVGRRVPLRQGSRRGCDAERGGSRRGRSRVGGRLGRGARGARVRGRALAGRADAALVGAGRLAADGRVVAEHEAGRGAHTGDLLGEHGG